MQTHADTSFYKRVQTLPGNLNPATLRREQQRVTTLPGLVASPVPTASCQRLLFDSGPVTRNVGRIRV